MVFDYAIWSRGEAQRPILLVCEEAHRYIPNERQRRQQRRSARSSSRIAKEGRKYGVSLGLITQRPSDLAEGVLSQMRHDHLDAPRTTTATRHFVRAAMPEGARGFLDSIPALRNRECIVCGEGVAIPIRVRFDELEQKKRPASEDPLFSQPVARNRRRGSRSSSAYAQKRWRVAVGADLQEPDPAQLPA